ncbi:ABC-2 transporter permease [Kineothrix sp. MB12-C1]|uniref:ABC-2 transporter permease n=1 Tax=Kineothrix sp. MB12-C1 TaxID=3070215 RepID=UPI0027D34460|nr:ABC-2 transporter permease [Kineothrix sp. MB12-C1]WMC91915.1 ABC-2 transporter permease [Kineothrix sp. MB12-C1]
MKGLLIKDLYLIWQQAKIFLLLVVVYVVMGVFVNNSFWIVFAVLFVSILPITALGLDERSKWVSYEAMLPYSRRDIVISKYVFGIIGGGIIIVIYIMLTVLAQIAKGQEIQSAEILSMVISMIAVSCFLVGTNLPIMFKYGVEKGRMWYLLSIALIIGGATFVTGIINGVWKVEKDPRLMLIKDALEGPMQGVIILVGSILLLLFSIILSIRIYEKRDI